MSMSTTDDGDRAATGKKHSHLAARPVSIIAALIMSVLVCWLFGYRHDYDSIGSGDVMFWVRTFMVGMIYATVQQASLPLQSATGSNLATAFDSALAFAPALLIICWTIFWMAWDRSFTAISPSNMLIGFFFGVYSVNDFVATIVNNNRMRQRQLGFGSSAN